MVTIGEDGHAQRRGNEYLAKFHWAYFLHEVRPLSGRHSGEKGDITYLKISQHLLI